MLVFVGIISGAKVVLYGKHGRRKVKEGLEKKQDNEVEEGDDSHSPLASR